MKKYNSAGECIGVTWPKNNGMTLREDKESKCWDCGQWFRASRPSLKNITDIQLLSRCWNCRRWYMKKQKQLLEQKLENAKKPPLIKRRRKKEDIK